MIRKLHQIERLQLKLAKRYHERVVKKGINTRSLIVLTIIELLLIIFVVNGDRSWFVLLSMVVLPFPIWFMIKGFRQERTNSKKLLKEIDRIESKGEVSSNLYQSTKALKFFSYDDEEILFVIQIGNQKCIAISQYEFDYTLDLPNSEFEIYSNEKTAEIFGTEIRNFGKHFQPITISGNIKSIVHEFLPKHKEIIEMGIDEFLTKLEEKTRPNKVQNVHSR